MLAANSQNGGMLLTFPFLHLTIRLQQPGFLNSLKVQVDKQNEVWNLAL